MPLTLPSIPAGHSVTAADWALVFAAIQQAYGTTTELATDQTKNANTTFATLSDLSQAVAANQHYDIKCWLIYSASTAADVKLQWTFPAASTFLQHAGSLPATDTVIANWYSGVQNTASGPVLGGTGVGVLMSALIEASLYTTAAGTLALQWAQNTSDATNTVIYAKSRLRVRQL